MSAMRTVGAARRPPTHANVRDEPRRYVIELDVSDFTEDELSVVALGPRVTVRGDQASRPGDAGEPLRLHECLEESFRLPDDADVDRIRVFWKHGKLELEVPRIALQVRRLPIEHRRFLINPDAEAC